jgi:regulator of sirC expression with transglutaminase-like and TPR domain
LELHRYDDRTAIYLMSTLALELFKEAITQPDENMNLALAALLIALDEYPHLNIQKYLGKIEWLTKKIELEIDFSFETHPLQAIEKINRVLFDAEGFCGNKENYYDPRNSYLNEVLDRRTGIPITLSVLYIEIGNRLGLEIKGVGMPGHFLTKFFHHGRQVFIDPFNGGETLDENGCRERLADIYGKDFVFDQSFLSAVSKTQILSRMLANLKAIYFSRQDFKKALPNIEKILLLNPDSAVEIRDRGIAYYKLDQLSRAIGDWSRYLELCPSAEDSEEIRKNISVLGQRIALRN